MIAPSDHKTKAELNKPGDMQGAEALRRPGGALLPPSFPEDYVQGAVLPFMQSGIYASDRPTLPMIDLFFSKEKAIPPHIWGMLYDDWRPNMEEDGLSVFLQGYDHRGPDNERKKIYMTAVTPDLYGPLYAEKIQRLFQQLFRPENEGKPLMHEYYQGYWDMYWDLHVGVRGQDIPQEVRDIGQNFNTVIGFWFPTLDVVRTSYQKVRELRPFLRQWIDDRVQDVIDGKVPDAEKTFVHYWINNGQEGENFRRKDIVFECFHNFLAFSQWGNTFYNIMARLREQGGDPTIREWFSRTMAQPDEADGTSFTALDRFVMELFRVIAPNAGSVSSLLTLKRPIGSGEGYDTIITPHLPTSQNPIQWEDPMDFNPDRYRSAPTTVQNTEAHTKELGLARCPFHQATFPLKDGRAGEMTNSAFGAVYPVLGGEAQPLVDTAGYAPFGLGYRRCAGEYLTIDAAKDFLRLVWQEGVAFETLDLAQPEKLPVGPVVAVDDNITFRRKSK